jgi:quinoprotein glucose dehydrogenase
MTYLSPDSGRQFVVIAAGGHRGGRLKEGDYVLAYTLPKSAVTSDQDQGIEQH